MSRRRPRRFQQARKIGRLVVVVCEGKSEYLYLRGLRDELREREQGTPRRLRFKLEDAGGHDPLHVVQTAIELRDTEANGATFFAVFDTEWGNDQHHEKQELLRRALALAAKKKITCVLSHPSFEVWLFCHLQSFNVCGFGNARSVLRIVEKRWQDEGICASGYEKAKEQIYEQSKPRQELALENAATLRTAHPPEKGISSESDAFTDVHSIVEHLLNDTALPDHLKNSK